jgi:hypothetical protein
MAQLGYDIVAHEGGWAILVTPGRSSAFPTKQDAFDAAARLVHKLRFIGCAIELRRDRGPDKARASAA